MYVFCSPREWNTNSPNSSQCNRLKKTNHCWELLVVSLVKYQVWQQICHAWWDHNRNTCWKFWLALQDHHWCMHLRSSRKLSNMDQPSNAMNNNSRRTTNPPPSVPPQPNDSDTIKKYFDIQLKPLERPMYMKHYPKWVDRLVFWQGAITSLILPHFLKNIWSQLWNTLAGSLHDAGQEFRMNSISYRCSPYS